jgi:hypothetical protein
VSTRVPAQKIDPVAERATLAGLVLAPVLAVLAVRAMGPGTAPRSASASVSAPLQPFAMPDKPTLTPAQRELARMIDEQLARGVGSSPLIRRRIGAAEPAPVARGESLRPPGVTLSSVFVGPSGPMAVVQGKLRSAGGEVEPGWTIRSIDGEGGVVVLIHASGATHELRLRPPGGK